MRITEILHVLDGLDFMVSKLLNKSWLANKNGIVGFYGRKKALLGSGV